MFKDMVGVEELRKAASVNDNMVKEPDCTEIKWHGISIMVKRVISLPEVFNFIKYVTDACFDYEDGEYMPEMRDFAFRSAIVQFYTNIVLPEDFMVQYNFLYGNSLIKNILSSNIIDGDQLLSIESGIDRKLHYLSDMDINRIKNGFDSMLETLSRLAENFGDIFGTIDGESIRKIASAVNNGMFDEAKLAKAFMEGKFIAPSTAEIKTDIIDTTENS